ncbi:Uncharacterised protein [Mycobacterium tuberculosis]|nr:Uncharacterised protein [Mycobacterium tuberculosis]
MAPSAAFSRSASSNTRSGACPPSSIDTFFIVSADWRTSSLPTSVEPVKVILRTTGLAIKVPTTSEAEPFTRFATPLGTPASCSALNTSMAASGVADAALRMIVQPAASAGASLRVIIAIGKFHGVIAPTTPTG